MIIKQYQYDIDKKNKMLSMILNNVNAIISITS